MKTDFIKIKPKWNKTKEEIWDECFAELEDKAVTKAIIPLYKRKLFSYVAAAAILIIILLPSVAFFYIKEIKTPKGQHYALNFPDGSKVQINADSKLTYKPLWWGLSRSVQLSGEAYFEVKKGSKFEVISDKAIVTVLGTSFNILARDKKYDVSCLTGKVKVENATQSFLLTQGMQVALNGEKLIQRNDDTQQAIDWTKNHFSFNAIPLSDVIEEIERQYNIQIVTPKNINYIYTGKFSKLDNPEEVLQIIEKPFGIKLEIKK